MEVHIDTEQEKETKKTKTIQKTFRESIYTVYPNKRCREVNKNGNEQIQFIVTPHYHFY